MAIFKETKIKSSILVTLTLLFILIGVIPLLITNWKLISINQEALGTNLRENLVVTAQTVSSQISNFVRANQDQVREFAARVAETPGKYTADSDQPPSLIKQSNILKVRILNTQGKGPYYQKFNFSDSVITNLEFEAFRQTVQGKSFFSSPYYSAADDITVLILAEPIRANSNQMNGVLTAVVDVRPLYQLINTQSEGGKVMYVVDSAGNLLLHPNKDQMKEPPNLSDRSIVFDYLQAKERISSVTPYRVKQGGQEVEIFGAYSPIQNLNWGVMVEIPKDIVYASVIAMKKESVKWAVIFALAACVLGFFFARWITRPVQELAQHALEIGRNRSFERRIEIKASNEIQQLADTFNFMTEEIRQYILSLQTAVRENKELFMSSIRMLAAAIDAKDPYTRGHSERVKDYSMVIARQMGFTAMELERMEIASLLHDVGKIGIEDRILRKPTNLTPEEFEVMKTHPDKGASILAQIAQLSDIIPGMRAHHENYDGSGYPRGLKGEDIPLTARVITVADTFDAMTTDRPYQKAFTLEFALNRIRTMSGIKYDPKVVEAFGRACEEGKVTLHKPSKPRPKPSVASV